MAHEWHSGVLNASSWHGLEVVKSMTTALDLISAGIDSKAYPLRVDLEKMKTVTGHDVPGAAVVATYAGQSRIVHGTVGARYTPLDLNEWRETIIAAVAAGARPAGAFALRGGSRVLATFELPGQDGEEIRSYLNIVDSLDGSLQFMAGGTSIRTVCANTLSMSFAADGHGYAKIRHTASINDRAASVRSAIDAHLTEGKTVAELYRGARDMKLSKDDAMQIFGALFPVAEDGDTKTMTTRLENDRAEATAAMKRPENFAGSTLATLWNAATWTVDRDANGAAKAARGDSDKLDSLLFGTRGKRIAEVRGIIESVLKTGSFAAPTKKTAKKSSAVAA